jgi:hypothetical protein
MKVAVLGFTDKRVVMLSLLALLQASGEVLFITPNEHYRRLIEGFTDSGSYGNCTVVVSHLLPDDAIEEYGIQPFDYEHTLIDCYGDVQTEVDKVLYVVSNYINDDERELLVSLEDIHPLYFFYSEKDKRKMSLPGIFMSKKGKEHLGETSTAYNDEEEEIIQGGKKAKKNPQVPRDMVAVPETLRATKMNSVFYAPEMLVELERAESSRVSPNFPQTDLAGALAKIFGKDFNMNAEGVRILLSKGGQISAR